MTLAQAEAFVRTVYKMTKRSPLIYTSAKWANGEPIGVGRTSLGGAIGAQSVLARCDLWLSDYRETPQLPAAWDGRGWRLWQYAENINDLTARAVPGVFQCDRNVFSGDKAALYRFWQGRSSYQS